MAPVWRVYAREFYRKTARAKPGDVWFSVHLADSVNDRLMIANHNYLMVGEYHTNTQTAAVEAAKRDYFAARGKCSVPPGRKVVAGG